MRKRAEVLLASEEVSKAIGKGGSNIRLASLLTGYEIDVFREGAEEDVELSEFEDDIEPWVIEEFRRIGLDTAKSVLEYSAEELELSKKYCVFLEKNSKTNIFTIEQYIQIYTNQHTF